MSFFGSLTGSDQRKDLRAGANNAVASLNQGLREARGDLSTGYTGSTQQYDAAHTQLQQSLGASTKALNRGTDAAIAAFSPYSQAGGQANTMYGNALGLNGLQAQKDFGANYASNDPFRAQNSGFATDDLMRSLNARGLSGSGYAASAVADQSLRRGSQDYQNYLTRLQGQQGQGFQAAGQVAGYQANRGNALAGLNTGYGNSQAGIYGQQAGASTEYGNSLANLNYGNGQQLAGIQTGLANGLAGARTAGVNNIIGLGTTAAKIALGIPPSGGGGSGGGETLPWLNGGRGGQATTFG